MCVFKSESLRRTGYNSRDPADQRVLDEEATTTTYSQHQKVALHLKIQSAQPQMPQQRPPPPRKSHWQCAPKHLASLFCLCRDLHAVCDSGIAKARTPQKRISEAFTSVGAPCPLRRRRWCPWVGDRDPRRLKSLLRGPG